MATPSGAMVLDRTSSLERMAGWEDSSFSERMIHFTKRLCVAPRRPEPEFSFCRHQYLCKAINRRNKVLCDCGEDQEELDWQWDQQRASASVRFLPSHAVCHETLSTGTALILGDTPLVHGYHHFWEVKILSDLYGTDTMVGVCTDRLEPETASQRFVSLLGGCASGQGGSEKAWGFSYHGLKRHSGVSEKYGTPFGKGSVVGVYANLRSGQLEFFLNRRSLGVAYTDLLKEDCRLLPAVCTTAANTFVRLITAISVPDSLQFQTTAVINRRIPDWSLVLPSAICRLIRRFPWLEYPARCGRDQQQNRSLVVVDDSPAQGTSPDRMALARVAAVPHRSDISETDADTDPSSASGAALPLAAPPRFSLGDGPEDTPDVVVRADGAGGRPAPGAGRPARLRILRTPEEEEEAARTEGTVPGASPPLRAAVQRPVVRIVSEGGAARRRSEVSLSTVTSNSRSVLAVLDAVTADRQSARSGVPDRNLPGNSHVGPTLPATNRAGAGREERKHARRSVRVRTSERAESVRTRRSVSLSDVSSASGRVCFRTKPSAAEGPGREVGVCVRRSVSASDLSVSVETDSWILQVTPAVPSVTGSVPSVRGGEVNPSVTAAEEGGVIDSGLTQRGGVAIIESGSCSNVIRTEGCARSRPKLKPVEEASKDDTAETMLFGGGELDIGSSEMSLSSVDESQSQLLKKMDTALLDDDLVADASSLVSAVNESTSHEPGGPITGIVEKQERQSATSAPDRAAANKPVPDPVETSIKEPDQPSGIPAEHGLVESGRLRLCVSPVEEAGSPVISTRPVSSETSREVVKLARRRSGRRSLTRGAKLKRSVKRQSSTGVCVLSEDDVAESVCGKRSVVLPLMTIKETAYPEREERATSLPVDPKQDDRGRCSTDHEVGVKIKRRRSSDCSFSALDVAMLDLADVSNAQDTSVRRETVQVQSASLRDGKEGGSEPAVNHHSSSAPLGARTVDHVSGPQPGTSRDVVGANTVTSTADPLPAVVRRAEPRSRDEDAGPVEPGEGEAAEADVAGVVDAGDSAPDLAPVTDAREMSSGGDRFRNVTVRRGRRRSCRPSADREGATKLRPEPEGGKSNESGAESMTAFSALHSCKRRVSVRRLTLVKHDEDDDGGEGNLRDVDRGAIGSVTQSSISREGVGKDGKTVPIGSVVASQVGKAAAARVDDALHAFAEERQDTASQHSGAVLVANVTEEKAARKRGSRARSGLVEDVVERTHRARRSCRLTVESSLCDGTASEESERVSKAFSADVERLMGCEGSSAGPAVSSRTTLPPGGTECYVPPGARRRASIVARAEVSEKRPRRASRIGGTPPREELAKTSTLKTARRASCAGTSEVAQEQKTARLSQRRASSVSDGDGKKGGLESTTQVTMRRASGAVVEYAEEKHSDGLEQFVKRRRSSHVISAKEIENRSRLDDADTLDQKQPEGVKKASRRRASGVGLEKPVRALPKTSERAIKRRASSVCVEEAGTVQADLAGRCRKRRASCAGLHQEKEGEMEKRAGPASKRLSNNIKQLEERQSENIGQTTRRRRSSRGLRIARDEEEPEVKPVTKRRASASLTDQARAESTRSKRRASCSGTSQSRGGAPREEESRATKPAPRRRASCSGTSQSRGRAPQEEERKAAEPAPRRRASCSGTSQSRGGAPREQESRSAEPAPRRRASCSGTSQSRGGALREEESRAAEPAPRRRASARRSSLSVGRQLDVVAEEDGEDAESPVIARRVRAHRQPRDGTAASVLRSAGAAPASVTSGNSSALGPDGEGGEVSEVRRRGRRSSMFGALPSGSRRLRVLLEESASDL